MKHRQVRQGTWETNSSSTHAYTLTTTRAKAPQYRPIVNGPIKVQGSASVNDNWDSRLGNLLAYLRITGKDNKIDFVKTTVEKFVGSPVALDFTLFDEAQARYASDVEGYFEDFGPSGEYDDYGSDVDDITAIFDNVVSSVENLENYIGSNGWVEVNEWYNG